MKNTPNKDFGVNINFRADRFYHCPLDKCETAPLENPQKQLFIENPVKHFSLWLLPEAMYLYLHLRQSLIN